MLPRISEAEVGDYLALLKPRVMSLVIFTALVGLVIAPGHVHPVLAFTSILCIAVGAGASGAMNMAYEGDIDALMSRTANRRSRADASPGEAMAFGLILAFFSVLTLGILVNFLAGALLAFTIFFDVVVYTMWLKRWTAQNIVIGGAAARCRRSWRGPRPPARCRWSRCCCPHHLLLDPARISGRWRCSVPTTMPAPAFRCCLLSPGPMRRGCRSCSTLSCWSRSRSHPAARLFRRHLRRHLAGARRRHDVAGHRGLSRPRGQGSALRATRRLFAFSILYLFALFATLLLEVVVRAIAPVFG